MRSLFIQPTAVNEDVVKSRLQERRWLALASLLVFIGFLTTFSAKTTEFTAIQAALEAGQIVNLSKNDRTDAIENQLTTIYPAPGERAFVARHISKTLNDLRDDAMIPGIWSLSNVGQLNGERFAISSRALEHQYPLLTNRHERLLEVYRSEGKDTTLIPIPVFESASQFRRYVKDAFVVRSPRSFKWTFWLITLLFFASFWLSHLFLFRRGYRGDPMLLPILLLLTGIGLLMMFSMRDSLRDMLLALDYAGGIVAGISATMIFSQLDFQHDRWFNPLGVSGKLANHGHWIYFLLALCFMILLRLFGVGPTGSDAHVNINIPGIGQFQPVEVVKLLIALFFAAHFALNWEFIRELKQWNVLPQWLQRFNLPRFKYVLPIGFCVVAAIFGFFFLKDMGPALVLCFSFLILYGIIRKRWIGALTGVTAVILVFMMAYTFPALNKHVTAVTSRIDMMRSPWNNFVSGGEQLAEAKWAMATGGWFGKGFSEGSPGYIPAAHTDMILPAIGEEIGFAGLVIILLLQGILLLKAIRISLRSGGEFSLFLGLSVTLLTFVQLALITGGTFGITPLSGVVAPYLSYGKTSMILHCAFIGILLALSNQQVNTTQHQYQSQEFFTPMKWLSRAMIGVILLLIGTAYMIQVVDAREIILKPSLVIRADQTRAFVYNPRIADARNTIPYGSVYDRNGVPLASSDEEELTAHTKTYQNLDLDINETLARVQTRYYPFGADAFYLLGNRVSRAKWGAENSLYAEFRYLDELRGYANHPYKSLETDSNNPDAPRVAKTQYDYSELLPLVRHGENHPASKRLLSRDRNVHLTIDIEFQKRIAAILEQRVINNKTASVVVLDAQTGEVLASVTSPKPEDAILNPNTFSTDPEGYDRGFAALRPPGSTLKVLTAMAALSKDPQLVHWRYRYNPSAQGPSHQFARRGGPVGLLTMKSAIAQSSNVYFAQLAHEEVGAAEMLNMLEQFNFRVSIKEDIPRDEKIRALTRYENSLRQAGFGQGPVVGGPLQVAHVAATIGQLGKKPEVHWRRDATPVEAGEQVLPRQQSQILASFMREVVAGRTGTARSLAGASIPIAGKTGTAEEEPPHLNRRVNHSWFMGFAPYSTSPDLDAPMIAFGVLVEDGGGGGAVAAPIAGDVVEAALDLGYVLPLDN